MNTSRTFPGQGEAEVKPYLGKRSDSTWKGNMYRRSFRDITELLDFATWMPPHATPMERRASRMDGSWYDSANFEEAVRLLREGWPEGLTDLAVAAEEINRSIQTMLPTRTPVNDVVGEAIDIGAYLEGVPEHMMALHTVDAPSKAIHVVANVSASGGITTAAIKARGGVITGLVYALENLGVPVRCTVYDVAATGSDIYIVDALVKSEGQPLDIGRLAFAIAHPAMLRRIFFSVEENETNAVRKVFGFAHGTGYGFVGEIPDAWRGDVYLSGADLRSLHWSTPERAVAWVVDRLRAIGVTLDG
jgi:hypothetical protein